MQQERIKTVFIVVSLDDDWCTRIERVFNTYNDAISFCKNYDGKEYFDCGDGWFRSNSKDEDDGDVSLYIDQRIVYGF